MQYSIIDTIGLEFETDSFSGNLPNVLAGSFSKTHDASIETDVYSTRSGLLFNKNNYPHCGLNVFEKTIGTEIVSVPIDTADSSYFKLIEELTNFLQNRGESEKSLRSGIHIHINLPYNLRILKSIIRVGRYLEDFYFLVGGNGYKFRGVKNDSIYCRPITKFGPPIVPTDNGPAQVFNIIDLLESTTSSEFFVKYGNNRIENGNGGSNHYHPSRYVWLNLHSLLLHSTLEFRIFNKTLNPWYIYAEINLCKKVAEFMLEGSFSAFKNLGILKENSIYDGRQKEEIFKTFREFADLVELDQETAEIIFDIMRRTPLPVLEKSYVYSHCRNLENFWHRCSYKPKIISENIKRPDYVDIHTLRGDR